MSGKYWKTSWNPVTGCTPISAGCEHCYAKAMATRCKAMGAPGYQQDDPFAVTVHRDKIELPLGWRKPRRVFCGSMSDLFHNDVTDETLQEIFAIMAVASKHTFIVCTKRAERMRQFAEWFTERHENHLGAPSPHVHLGVSVEREDYLHRAETLLQTPAAVRWLSLEPLLGPIDLLPVIADSQCGNCGWLGFIDNDTPEGGLRKDYKSKKDTDGYWVCPSCEAEEEGYMLDYFPGYNPTGPDATLSWVVVGTESGPKRRPCKMEWIESIVEQCANAGVACWVKQIELGGKVTGDVTKFPKHLQKRELPERKLI